MQGWIVQGRIVWGRIVQGQIVPVPVHAGGVAGQTLLLSRELYDSERYLSEEGRHPMFLSD